MLNSIKKDFKIFENYISLNCELEVSNYITHEESKEYGACSFILNNQTIQFRVSKITPTKTGQFVTIWKRNALGNTEPFHELDNLDFVIISCRRDDSLGQFIFPKQVLIAQGIISTANKMGKRGIRVYPPWDITENKQATKTQKWQLYYFLNMSTENQTHINFAKQILT